MLVRTYLSCSESLSKFQKVTVYQCHFQTLHFRLILVYNKCIHLGYFRQPESVEQIHQRDQEKEDAEDEKNKHWLPAWGQEFSSLYLNLWPAASFSMKQMATWHKNHLQMGCPFFFFFYQWSGWLAHRQRSRSGGGSRPLATGPIAMPCWTSGIYTAYRKAIRRQLYPFLQKQDQECPVRVYVQRETSNAKGISCTSFLM